MFPEYRDLISKLKSSDVHFQEKFDLHTTQEMDLQNFFVNVFYIRSDTQQCVFPKN